MLELRRSLPAYKEKDALLTAISRNQVSHYLSRKFNSPSLQDVISDFGPGFTIWFGVC